MDRDFGQTLLERRAVVVWADLSDERGFVTGKLRTVVDCGRRCEFVVALSIADRAVFMERGQVSFEGPAQELLERGDLLRAVFLSGAGA